MPRSFGRLPVPNACCLATNVDTSLHSVRAQVERYGLGPLHGRCVAHRGSRVLKPVGMGALTSKLPPRCRCNGRPVRHPPGSEPGIQKMRACPHARGAGALYPMCSHAPPDYLGLTAGPCLQACSSASSSNTPARARSLARPLLSLSHPSRRTTDRQ